MNVHNLMEEYVYTGVNELFDDPEIGKQEWFTCNCEQCRIDTICFVLNRIQPRYIKSGRGLVYSKIEEIYDKSQIMADINHLALEGMKQVLSTRRPHAEKVDTFPEAPVFNFPTIVGRILDGQTFEPVKDIFVSLLMDSKLTEAIDCTWENPYRISKYTPGTFTFWPKPVSTKFENTKKVFSFEIRVEEKGFDLIRYYFEIGLSSESFIRTAYNARNSFFLPDLHLFPEHDKLDYMQYCL
ncbi:late competence development ComFB family protein [Brucepastera parasyntrophica]|uniref:late competence development ComFB family protein n=1 Tax=Brucepastera parasyntrophica TaxID=2880008 RepID=UPI00210CC5E5|nr:late competence development ComFB family protein [Brucepastera parasyntrophica]ULQ60151.1 late competence development ComFB family protein [Brucepastera parasyntrophica]